MRKQAEHPIPENGIQKCLWYRSYFAHTVSEWNPQFQITVAYVPATNVVHALYDDHIPKYRLGEVVQQKSSVGVWAVVEAVCATS